MKGWKNMPALENFVSANNHEKDIVYWHWGRCTIIWNPKFCYILVHVWKVSFSEKCGRARTKTKKRTQFFFPLTRNRQKWLLPDSLTVIVHWLLNDYLLRVTLYRFSVPYTIVLLIFYTRVENPWLWYFK